MAHLEAQPASALDSLDSAGQSLSGIEAEVIPGGGLAVFALRDGGIHHTWQDQPYSGWRDCDLLLEALRRCDALRAAGSRVGPRPVRDWRRRRGVPPLRQDRPFAPWHDWESLGGSVASISVTKSRVAVWRCSASAWIRRCATGIS